MSDMDSRSNDPKTTRKSSRKRKPTNKVAEVVKFKAIPKLSQRHRKRTKSTSGDDSSLQAISSRTRSSSERTSQDHNHNVDPDDLSHSNADAKPFCSQWKKPKSCQSVTFKTPISDSLYRSEVDDAKCTGRSEINEASDVDNSSQTHYQAGSREFSTVCPSQSTLGGDSTQNILGLHDKNDSSEINDCQHDSNDCQHDSNDCQHDSNDSQHDSNDSQHDSNDCQHDSNDCQHDSNDSQHDSNDCQHDSNDCQHDSNDSQHDSNDCQHDSNDCQHDSNDSQHDSNDSQHDSNDSQHDSNDSQHDSNDSVQSNVPRQEGNDFETAIRNLKINEKSVIFKLTELAKDLDPSYTIDTIIRESGGILMLYVMDSIVKTIGGVFVEVISGKIVPIFRTIFKHSDTETRKKLKALKTTWTGIFPAKTLLSLDDAINASSLTKSLGQTENLRDNKPGDGRKRKSQVNWSPAAKRKKIPATIGRKRPTIRRKTAKNGLKQSASNLRVHPIVTFSSSSVQGSQIVNYLAPSSQPTDTSENRSASSTSASQVFEPNLTTDQNKTAVSTSEHILLRYSSDNASPPTVKSVRRKRTNKDWVLMDTYRTYDDALNEVKAQSTWSICSSNDEFVLFRCTKVKKTFLQCQSGMRIQLHKKDLGASLFVSRNEHNCSELTQATSKLTPEVRAFIADLHAKGMKLKAVQDEFIKVKKPLPARSVLANEIARLRRMDTGEAVIKLSELHDLLKQHSKIPDDEFKAYVLDFKIADEAEVRFDFVVSCKTLLDLNTRSQVCNADTTYNLVWQGYPVQVTGHTDYNKKFHPSAISVSTNEDEETYAFIFQTLKDGTGAALSKDLKQSILMADGAKAISNGFRRAFGSDFIELMCWYHAKTAMKDNITHLVPKELQEQLLQDIDRLQLSQTPSMFDKASVLFLEKYSQYTEFVDYFTQQWLHLHRNWYEGACVDRDIKAPGTNNGLEVFNRTVKDEKTFRRLLPLQEFFQLLLTWVESWARRYDGGATVYHWNVEIDLPLETKAYQWVRLKKEIRKHPSANFYMIPAGDAVALDHWEDSLSWETFDQFTTNVFKGWSTTVDTDWKDGSCNCPSFLKDYMCKHVYGVAMCLKLVTPRFEAKQIPLGQKRKRGRPKLAKKALIKS